MSATWIHELKTWPKSFEALWIGACTFSIRYDDRDFLVGQSIVFREWDPVTVSYSGRSLMRRITHISNWNQKPQYVVLGVAP